MKAIILAAGIGSRLRPITDEKPKALVNVNSKPIIYYTLKSLMQNGIDEVILCVGYKATYLVNFCESNFPEINFTFVENKIYEDTNNMYSLYLAKEHLEGDVFIMNADVMFDQKIIKGMLEVSSSCVAVDVGRYIDESMKVEVVDGMIVGMSKSITQANAYGSSIDIYKFKAQDLKAINQELKRIIKKQKIMNQWTEVMLDNLFKQKKINVTVYNIENSKWYEIDNFEDLEQAEMIFNTQISDLKNKKVFFIDLDGTLKLGDKVIDGAVDFIKALRDKEKKIFLLTNNSSRTPQQYFEKFSSLGLDLRTEDILVSLQPAIAYFKKKNIRRIYWVANEIVSSFLVKQGFVYENKKPEAVFLTYDDQITYAKLKRSVLLINKGIPYYATHSDIVCPTPYGDIPDIGTFIKVIEMTTGRLPNKIFGKPNKDFLIPILKSINIAPSEAVVIGDRLYTDITLGVNTNVQTILVLSGETKRGDYEGKSIKSDMIVPSIKDLVKYL